MEGLKPREKGDLIESRKTRTSAESLMGKEKLGVQSTGDVFVEGRINHWTIRKWPRVNWLDIPPNVTFADLQGFLH